MAKKESIGWFDVQYRYCPGSVPFQGSVTVCFHSDKFLPEEICSHVRVMGEVFSGAWGNYSESPKCRYKEAWFSGENWEDLNKAVEQFISKVTLEVREAVKLRKKVLAEKPDDFSAPILI